MKKTRTSAGTILGWSDVLLAVQTTEARHRLVRAIRAYGYTPDNVMSSRAGMGVLADALTLSEDYLELQGRTSRARETERENIRTLRRALEDKVLS